ncbi:MAG: SPASM domain-containing protein [Clostridia bacterium]|nr:SPASM domain-containing protein [Clostridia bacterium]
MNRPILSMIVCLSKKSLPINYYKKLLYDFSNNFGYHIQIDGEPFQYNELDKLLELLKELNIKDVGIRTNEKITQKEIDLICKYNIRSIMFKHNNKYLDNNLRIAKENAISTEVSVILEKSDINNIDKLIQQYEQKKINLLVFERSIIAKYRNTNYDPLEPTDYENVMKKILKYNLTNQKLGIAISHCPNKILLHNSEKYVENVGGCSAGIISCAINKNGDIIPCLPLFKVILGNISSDSIIDVWNNSSIIKQLQNRKLLKGKCGECEFINSCGGCRAESYYKFNSLFNEDITCWKE